MKPESKDIICSRCSGTGSIGHESETIHYAAPPAPKYEISFEFTYMCPKCRGKGKVDWISNIVGSKELIITSTQHHKEVYKWTKL